MAESKQRADVAKKIIRGVFLTHPATGNKRSLVNQLVDLVFQIHIPRNSEAASRSYIGDLYRDTNLYSGTQVKGSN